MKLHCSVFLTCLLSAVLPLMAADQRAELLSAVKRHSLADIDSLISQGTDVNGVANGTTPLVHALDRGQEWTDVADLLLRRGASVSARTVKGRTPLMAAAALGDVPMIKRLLKAGADVNALANDGEAALGFVIKSGSLEAMEAILGAKPGLRAQNNRPFVLLAVLRGDFEAVKLLLKHGADINDHCENGFSPVMAAAEKNLPKLVQLLLSKGADLRATHQKDDGVSHNALCCAVCSGATASVRLLLALGVDPHWQNDIAIREARAVGEKEIEALLLQPKKNVQPTKAAVASSDDKMRLPADAEPVVAALASFIAEDNSWKSGQQAADFSAILQAQLGGLPGVTWVERDTIQKAEAEINLHASGALSQASPLRLGKWLNAQLLVTGRFSADEGQGSTLTVEILDLQRADVLARRSRVIRMPADKRFALTATDAQATAPLVRSALAEAAQASLAGRTQVIVAPLSFRNVSEKSDRLDFLERDLATVFSKAGGKTQRIVQFPQAGRAAEESELVLSGLVEANPQAWKRVADYYVWGEYEEMEASNVAFDQVQVRLRLQVWDGSTAPAAHLASFRVGELTTALPQAVAKVLASLPAKPAAPPSDSVRDTVAKSLLDRVSDLQAKETDSMEAYQRTAGWMNRWRLRRGLLEVANFFAPGDGAAHRELILERWNNVAVFHTYKDKWKSRDFWNKWQRNEDWRTHVERYGFTYLNTPVPRLKYRIDHRMPGDLSFEGTLSIGTPRENYYLGLSEQAARNVDEQVQGFPDEVPEQVHRQWYQHFLDELCGRLATVAGPSASKYYCIYFPKFVEDVSAVRDLPKRAEGAVALWRLSQHLPSPLETTVMERIKTVVESSLRDAGRGAESAQILAETIKPRVPSIYERAGRIGPTNFDPDAVHEAQRDRIQANLADTTHLPGEVKARFTPLKLDPAFSFEAGIERVSWFDGELVVAADVLNAQGSRGCTAVWSYDCATRRFENIPALERPQMHLYTTILPTGKTCWMTNNGSGVFRLDGKTHAVQHYTDRDGLASEHMSACVLGDGELFCGGGTVTESRLASFSGKDRRWSSIVSPPGEQDGLIASLAWSKHKLLSYQYIKGNHHGKVFDTRKRSWAEAPAQLAKFDWKKVATVGDGSGFWVGHLAGLYWFDPEGGEPAVQLNTPTPLIGEVTCMLDDGVFLWIATNDLDMRVQFDWINQARLYCIHKPSRRLVGFLRVPYNEAVNSIAVSPDKIWIAIHNSRGPADCLFELDKKDFLSVPAASLQPLTVTPLAGQ